MAYNKPRVVMKPGQIKIHMDDGTSKSVIWPTMQASIQDIKNKFGISPDKMVIEKQGKGTKKHNNSGNLNLSNGVELAIGPNVTQGALWRC